jgi:hypothetical protein
VVRVFERLINSQDSKFYNNYFNIFNRNRNSGFETELTHKDFHARIQAVKEDRDGRDYINYLVTGKVDKNSDAIYYGTRRGNFIKTDFEFIYQRYNGHVFYGGEGGDTFRFNNSEDSVIRDFNDDGDRIDINQFADYEITNQGGAVYLKQVDDIGETKIEGSRVGYEDLRNAYNRLKNDDAQDFFK